MTAIRRATPDDAAVLAELRWEFRSDRPDAHEPHDSFVVRCAEWMRSELAGSTWRVWVALQDDRIVGNVWLGTIPKLPNPGAEREEHAYISNVYVTPSSRGGVGRALLEAALADAAGRADRVILWPSGLSKTLYARYGFAPIGNLMELKCR
ncbi:MAG TPA: GNAT family N-acetyltransferase [Vicinamibacterales bacterium]|nr:GNAT family N-acetyltransferase [Vicinamibacterales bacterium]